MDSAVISSEKNILERRSDQGNGNISEELMDILEGFQFENETQHGSSGNTIRIPVETVFRELDDGSLVELVEDPVDRTRTRLAVWQDGEVRYENQLICGGQVLVPQQRSGQILPHLRLPELACPYGSVEVLHQEIRKFLSDCVTLSTDYDYILACFVLSTWLVDRFSVAPYVSLVGLPQSGKTTLLRTLSLICRHALLVADISSAAFYEACSQVSPTLLIDEAGTHGNPRQLYHLLRMGTTPDLLAMRKNQTFNAFGAKVIAFLEAPDDPALNSRCLLVPMHEASQSRFAKPADAAIQARGTELRNKLLQYRFDHYKSIRPAEVAGSQELRPRTRDLLSIMAAPFEGEKRPCENLLGFFKRHEEARKEPLDPEKSAVLAALFSVVHIHRAGSSTMVSEFTGIVNDMLIRGGEKLRLTPRKVGSVLNSLGILSRKRVSGGWKITLYRSDNEHIHTMVKNHGLDNLVLLYFEELAEAQDLEWLPPKKCPLCKELHIQ